MSRSAGLPRDLVSAVRRLDEARLRRLLILVRGLLLDSEHVVDTTAAVGAAVHYRQQHIRCGKDCSACPHGPYWYAFWKEDGRTRSVYIGASLAADVARLVEDTAESDENLQTVTKLPAASADRWV